jgi:hypothetical protein
MGDNHVFSGIPEIREDTEAILQDFIQTKYKMDYETSFERVHRIGKLSEFNVHPPNIVAAKFTYFMDKDSCSPMTIRIKNQGK